MKKVLLATAFLTASTSAQAAGVLIGNGGDLVSCSSTPGSPFAGSYTLDYLVTFRHDNGNADIHPAAGELGVLQTLLDAKLPSLGRSLADFRLLIGNDDPTHARLWRPASLGLIDLQDELLIEKLPANCLGDDGHPKLMQVMVREKREALTLYHYDVELMKKLEQDRLQHAFLMTHEWLWDHVGDARVNRDVNRYLHSLDFAGATPARARLVLSNLGLRVPRDAWYFPFDTDACPQDGSLPPRLEPLARSAQGNGHSFAPFHIKMRNRFCDAMGGCGAWTESGILASTSFGRLRVTSEDDVVTRFDVLLGHSWKANECTLNRATGEISCSVFNTPTTGPQRVGDRDLVLGGHATDRCLKLSFRNEYSYGNGIEETEIALVGEYAPEMPR